MPTPTSQRRWFRATEIALWALGVLALLHRALPPRDVGRIAVDAPAPAFSLRSLDGQRVSLASFKGQVVLVNFWATWCPPCRLEMPGFQAVYDDYRDKGFTVVGISMDQGGAATVQSFVRNSGIAYPVAMADGDVQLRYGGVDALPQSFLVDRQGRVREMVSGVFSEGTLRRVVEQLLAEEVGA